MSLKDITGYFDDDDRALNALLMLSDQSFVEDLRNKVKHHPPSHDGIATKHVEWREEIFRLGLIIGLLVPKGREQSVALTKLEEMMFWGNAGIARNQSSND